MSKCTSREVGSGKEEALSCDHILIKECQLDNLRRDRKGSLSGGLVCTFGDRSKDRLDHWTSLEGIIRSHWPVFTSYHVETQLLHRMSDSRWRLCSLQKIGKVDLPNPKSKEIAYSGAELPKVEMDRFNTTLEPGTNVLQKGNMAWEKKIGEGVRVSNLNKRKITSNEMGPKRKQVDRFVKTLKLVPRLNKKERQSEN